MTSQTKVQLLKAHTHKGSSMAPGDVFSLPKAKAEKLIALGIAKKASSPRSFQRPQLSEPNTESNDLGDN